MNTLMITQVSNGYVLVLCDEDSNEIDTAIAPKTDTRGYGSCSLVTAIEDIFERNVPKAIAELPVATCKEDADKAAY